VKVLVTGANGFAGSWLIRRLLERGHDVIGAAGAGSASILTEEERSRITWVPLELGDTDSVRACVTREFDRLVHLAGLASVSESFEDPIRAWEVNALGTVRLMDGLMARREAEDAFDPQVLVVSSGEVYGRWPSNEDPRPRRETDPVAPLSPYACSKAAAEIAALSAWRRTGLRVVIARAFPHTGIGQSTRFVVPAFIERVRKVKRANRRRIRTGNLEPMRDFLDVRDVARAYSALLERGVAGEIYNVASGRGITLEDVLFTACELQAWDVIPEPDPDLVRTGDIPHLVGDPAKLHALTGWKARYQMDTIIEQMLHA
jgi:GDP-4-dehydro-6-deoxy-D-mannose reductase